MRFRLLRRRLTISAPRMAVRSALPLRWVVLALVMGLCAAVALWAFEFGKSIAGLDSAPPDEWVAQQTEISQLRETSARQQAVAQTAQSVLTAERATTQGLMAQVRQLEAENRALREDLAFFDKLAPVANTDGIAIRGLQAEILAGMQLRWQVLILQAARNAPEFTGKLEVVLAGTQDGHPWTQTQPPQGQPLQFRQYRRVEGVFDLPSHAVVKTVTVRILFGSTVRVSQTVELSAPR